MVVAEASGVKLRSPHHLCDSGGACVLHTVNKQGWTSSEWNTVLCGCGKGKSMSGALHHAGSQLAADGSVSS